MSAHKHDWKPVGGCKENPGIHSSGGSVKHVEACTCGRRKTTDYWDHATNRPATTPRVSYSSAAGMYRDAGGHYALRARG